MYRVTADAYFLNHFLRDSADPDSGIVPAWDDGGTVRSVGLSAMAVPAVDELQEVHLVYRDTGNGTTVDTLQGVRSMNSVFELMVLAPDSAMLTRIGSKLHERARDQSERWRGKIVNKGTSAYLDESRRWQDTWFIQVSA